jgi:hypothetical protein
VKLLNYNWDLEIHSNINGGILVKEWRTNCMWSEDKWKLCETKVKLKGLSCMDKLDTNDFGYMSQKKGWDTCLWRNLAMDCLQDMIVAFIPHHSWKRTIGPTSKMRPKSMSKIAWCAKTIVDQSLRNKRSFCGPSQFYMKLERALILHDKLLTFKRISYNHGGAGLVQ